MIIVVAQKKGGNSKSCLCTNIAVKLQQDGRKVMLIDTDPQKTTTDWLLMRRESEKYPDIRYAFLEGKCNEDLLAFEKDGYDVIVDTAGSDSDTVRWAMLAGTHILTPVRPKRRDLKVLPQMKDVLSQTLINNPNAKVRAVLVQAPTHATQKYRINDALDVCEAFEIQPLQTIQYMRNVYDDSDEAGASVFEYKYGYQKIQKAIDEMTNLVEEFIYDKR